jgi:hypothetical protein
MREIRGEEEEIHHLKKIEALLEQQVNLLAQIMLELKPKVAGEAVSIAIKFEERKKMPLQITSNNTNEKFFIIGTDKDGLAGAQLAPGQTITVVSSDPTVVDFKLDPAPLPDAEGVASVASGSVNPVKVGGPINCTATVVNADGTPAESVVDTVTVVAPAPGVAVSIGELFEQGVSGVTPAASKKPSK